MHPISLEMFIFSDVGYMCICMCMRVCAHMHVCVRECLRALRGQGTVPSPRKLELWVVVGHLHGAGNRTQALWGEVQAPLTA